MLTLDIPLLLNLPNKPLNNTLIRKLGPDVAKIRTIEQITIDKTALIISITCFSVSGWHPIVKKMKTDMHLIKKGVA